MLMKKASGKLIGIFSVLIIMAAIGILFSATALAANTTYYVNNQTGSNCNDANAGTVMGSPWCTFNNINSHAAFGAGDQILLARGATWNQQMTITGTGTSGSWVTLGAYGTGNKPKINRNGAETERAIRLNNPTYFKVTDLEIASAGTGILVNFSTAAHDGLLFQNLYFHDIYGIHQGSGSGAADAIWNSAGIEFTSLTFDSAHPASTYIVNNVNFSNIEGTHNLDTLSIDWYNSTFMYANGGHKAAENVVMNNLYMHDDNAGGGTGCDDGMRLTSVRYLTLINSKLIGEGGCHSNTGTAAIYIAFVSDTNIFNSLFTNVPNTSSPDMVAFDYECCTDNLKINQNYIAGNAGSGISYLAIHPGLGLETNSDAAGNTFINNGNGSFRRAGTSDTPTGTIRNNFYSEPNNFLYLDGANYSGFTLTNNLSIPSGASNIYHSGNQFSATQGSNNWTYQSYNGTSWSNLAYYDSAAGVWQPSSGVNIPQVSTFEQHPSNCAGCIVARAWTAPATGTISIRGRVLKSDNSGGDGIVARITKNGTRIWPTGSDQAIAYNDRVGVEQNLDSIAVTAGDVLRFEVTSGASNNNANDMTSWVPSIAYTSSTIAYQWDFNTNGNTEGWTNANQITQSVSGGINTLTSSGTDPYMISGDNLGITNAATNRFIKIKLKNNTASTGAEFFFTTTTSTTFDAAKSVAFTTAANAGSYTEYTVDMGVNANWTGTIKQLRFDPFGATGTMNVDYIIVTSVGSGSGTSYNSVSGFSSTQGTNQWSYKQTSDLVTYTNMGTWIPANSWWQGSGGAIISATWQHPDSGAIKSARTFTAPTAGTVTISGSAKKDPGATLGNGVNVKIMKNSTQIWPASGYQFIAASDTTGYSFNFTTAVSVNDNIYFVVDANGDNTYDTTIFGATITYP